MPILGELKKQDFWLWVELRAQLIQECYKNNQNAVVIREDEMTVRDEINARVKAEESTDPVKRAAP